MKRFIYTFCYKIVKEVNEITLTFYDWIYGTAQIAAVFLAIVALFVSAGVLKAQKKTEFIALKMLFAVLVLFTINEILGALDTFDILQPTFWSFLLSSFVFLFFIVALVFQILAKKGWLK